MSIQAICGGQCGSNIQGIETGRQGHTPPLKCISVLAGKAWADAIAESWLDRLAGDNMHTHCSLVCIYHRSVRGLTFRERAGSPVP